MKKIIAFIIIFPFLPFIWIIDSVIWACNIWFKTEEKLTKQLLEVRPLITWTDNPKVEKYY